MEINIPLDTVRCNVSDWDCTLMCYNDKGWHTAVPLEAGYKYTVVELMVASNGKKYAIVESTLI